MTDVSVIGCGNMGSALLKGLSKAGSHTLTACDLDPDALESVAEYSSTTTSDPAVAAEADVVIVAVKPDIVMHVVDDIDLSADQTLVTLAAGVSTDVIEPHTDATVVRIMPNLAAETGNMAAAVTQHSVTDDVRELLDDVGEFVEIDEQQMDIATAVNGSGPAFVFYLLNAMKQAGVEGGLDDDEAKTLAAQTFKGAAETVLQSDQSIDDLIDAVCSPNGTTIEGMEVLWDSNADEAVVDAVSAAERRSKELAMESEDE
ncbi:pyrroline-5-carboxylate reductase [Natronorubrum aibiense]|uniref:Pyrroline-5-carboxylate reductase n=2 Tax=Natronorubrum aibiense TaxID=348826 RepID=A0A5P9P155_9EURY|nr:pyrroline-5-carboxylate reductase [Natronorubrum aibiense]